MAALAAIAFLLMSLAAGSARAMLAPTPYMGWNTYYGIGGGYNEQTITSVADSLVASGLAGAGYRIVWLDFGWASGARDDQGELVIDTNQWPHGMAWLADYLHQRGLLAGIYTDAGASGCGGQGVGSLGHYQQDADTFAAWGFDAVKVDFCGAGQAGLTPQSQYTQFADALANNSSHRPMLLNVTNFWQPGQIDGTRPSWADSAFANYQWAPQIAQSWRTATDVGFGGGRGIHFADVLRNLDADAAHPEAAGPGHWNDPDYLGPELGMTSGQAQAQFSMWAMLAAPLILGSDPRTLSAETIAMLANPRVIAVDQDALGVQARLITSQGEGQVWVKPLAGGDRAIALLNRGTSARQISTTATAVGLSSAPSYRLEDLWTGRTTETPGSITASVAGQSVVLYRVQGVRGAPATDAAAGLRGVVAVAGPGRHLYVHAPQLGQGWHNLGGDLRAAPAVADATGPRGRGRLLFVVLGRDHRLWVRGTAGPWRKLSPRAYCLDNPAVAIWGSGLYVACQGSDHALWYGKATIRGGALPWVARFASLGGRLSAGPAIAPVGGTLTFLVSGGDHQLYTRTISGRYRPHRLTCQGHPAAGRAPGQRQTYVACNGGSALWVITSAGHGWSRRTRYGGSIIDGPAVAASKPVPTFYAQAPDHSLWIATGRNRWFAAAFSGVQHGAGAG